MATGTKDTAAADAKPDTEEQLISRAQVAVSRCNWVVGECAAAWTERYAKGRTDVDFGALVGMSADQIYQRRRVWETFGEVHEKFPHLKWSHYYVALNWEDAQECLEWADENEATVAEMRAWRRAMRGEDLSEPPPFDTWAGEPTVGYVPTDPVAVRDPDETTAARKGEGGDGVPSREPGRPEQGYAPFRKDAGSAPGEGGNSESIAPPPNAEQIFKRLVGTLERMNRALTPEFLNKWDHFPDNLRDKFVQALAEMREKTADLHQPVG